MSLYLNISLHAPQQQLPDLVEILYDQLLKRGRLDHYMIHTGAFDEGKYFESKSAPSDLYFSKEQLHAIAREILLSDSNKALWLELNYELSSGFRLPIDMLLCGNSYSWGDLALREGPIVLTVEYDDMSRSVSEIYAQERGSTMDDEYLSNLPKSALEQLWEHFHAEVTRNVSELLFTAVGLYRSGGRCADFEHGAVGGAVVASSPAFYSAIFHKDRGEFARDFTRIYLEYNRGIPMPMTLHPHLDLWKLEPPKPMMPQGTMLPGKLDTRRYQSYMWHGTGGALGFLKDLTRAKAEQLSRLSGHEIRDALRKMERRGNSSSIEVHDFGDCGLALTTNPRETLWHAYAYIADHFN